MREIYTQLFLSLGLFFLSLHPSGNKTSYFTGSVVRVRWYQCTFLHTVTCQAVFQLTVTTSFHAHMALLLRTTPCKAFSPKTLNIHLDEKNNKFCSLEVISWYKVIRNTDSIHQFQSSAFLLTLNVGVSLSKQVSAVPMETTSLWMLLNACLEDRCFIFRGNLNNTLNESVIL